MSRASLYRALDGLERLGLAERLEPTFLIVVYAILVAIAIGSFGILRRSTITISWISCA